MDAGLNEPYAAEVYRGSLGGSSEADEVRKKRSRLALAVVLVLFFLIYFCYLNAKLHSSVGPRVVVESTTIRSGDGGDGAPEEYFDGSFAATESTTTAAATSDKKAVDDDDEPPPFPIKGFCRAYTRCLLKAASRPVPVGEAADDDDGAFLCSPAAPCDFSYLRCNATESGTICRSRSYFFSLGPMGNLVSVEAGSAEELKVLIAACDRCPSVGDRT